MIERDRLYTLIVKQSIQTIDPAFEQFAVLERANC